MRRRGAPSRDFETAQPGTGRRFVSWLTTSRRLLVFALVLAAVMAGGVVYLVLVPQQEPKAIAGDYAAGAVPLPSVPAVPVDPPPSEALCAPRDAQEVPPETLVLSSYDTTWALDDGVLLPRSDAAGPDVPEPMRACYTRTPEGALYSAASFYIASGAAVSPQDRIDLVRLRASRTGAYAQLMDQLAADPSTAGVAGTTSQLRVIGYRWLGYTPDTASLELQFLRVTSAQEQSTVQMAMDLVWEGNDWLAVVPSLNSQLYRPAPSQVVYTPWGPPA